MSRTTALRLLPVLLLWLGGNVTTTAAQSAAIQYAYDELGRLVAVVDQQGNTAIYAYDAVGNILSIQRVDAGASPAPVAITAVVPERGKAGAVVSILGKGFAATPAQNAVAFNGAPAPVTRASANRLVTTVPSGATTGPVTVTAPLGSAVSPHPFHVIGTLAIAPATATLGPGASQAFVASDEVGQTARVRWSVESVVGGDAQVGTISPEGLYAAPATIESTRTVTISATSTDDAALVATAAVTLRPPLPAFLAATAVGVRVADAGLRTLVAPGVGVQRAPTGEGSVVVAATVGVAPSSREGFAGAAPVSVSREPLQ